MWKNKFIISIAALLLGSTTVIGYFIFKETGSNDLLRIARDGYLSELAYDLGIKSYPSKPIALVKVIGESELSLKSFPSPFVSFKKQKFHKHHYSEIDVSKSPSWMCTWKADKTDRPHKTYSDKAPIIVNLNCKFGKHWGGNVLSSDYLILFADFENSKKPTVKNISINSTYRDYSKYNIKDTYSNFKSRNNELDLNDLDIKINSIRWPKNSVDSFDFNFSVNAPRRLNPGGRLYSERYVFDFSGQAHPKYTNFK